MANPSDPWSWDAFDVTDAPKVDAPEPFKPKQRMFPEEDRLFQVQRDALRAHRTAQDLERELRGKNIGRHAERELRSLLNETEDTYRVIRSYLNKYVGGGVGAS
jgi:hypothetical protein